MISGYSLANSPHQTLHQAFYFSQAEATTSGKASQKGNAQSVMMIKVVLAMVVQGMGLFVRTLWRLQERRFSVTFEAVSSAAVSITMALVVCFFSVHRHSRGDIVLPFM
ncbi:hypothetical protein ACOSQ3_023747 [Xanthoceras sorbifolium]